MGSLFVMGGLALLRGPRAHLAHMFSKDRMLFSVVYVGSMFGTLYFAVIQQAYIMTLLFGIVQVVALVWYVVSYLPGGSSTLSMGTRMVGQTVGSMLNV